MSNTVVKRITTCFSNARKPALKTALWLLKIMIPISLAMVLLQYFGLLAWISKAIEPLFSLLGLPGDAALAYLSGVFVCVYACISAMGILTLTAKQVTIMAIMCLISHNMIVETAVQKRTGSSAWRMVAWRISMAFVAGYILNLLLPADTTPIITGGLKYAGTQNILQVLQSWSIDTLWLTAKVMVLVTSLMFLQKMLEEFGLNTWLSKLFAPLMQAMALPRETSFLWIVANTLGLAYGSAIIIEQVENGNLSPKSADLLNHHIAISHSLLEDTLLFVAIGAFAPWIIFPRILIGIFATWTRRLELSLASK